MKLSLVAFWTAVALVIGIFFFSAGQGGTEWGGSDPGDLYYNLLVRGFRAGQLSLAREAPPGLAALGNPYDPAANAPYRTAPYFLQDASYYHGKLYLYFGLTPALVLFWPWVLLTGHYLSHKYAVAIFCSVGFLVGAYLWRAVARRYFPLVPTAVMLAGVFALGLAAGMPLLLQRPGICEVPIGCAYAFVMLALAALWRALHRPATQGRWLALASLAYGFAMGARPSDLFGAALLLVPLWLDFRRTGRVAWRLAAAAVLPLALCGAVLLAYNALRFGSPFDFGHAYQLSDVGLAPGFDPGYLGYNLRFYFLAPTYWTGIFPFAQGIRLPALPRGYYPPDGVFGILPNIPLVFLALAAPLALRDRAAEDRARLAGVLAAIAGLFLLILAPLLCYFAACGRYEAEFLPPLILLAGIGILALERACARIAGWRAAWIALLVFSIAFNLLASCGRYAAERYTEGLVLAQAGQRAEATGKLRTAVRVNPGFAQAHLALGRVWLELGRPAEAIPEYQAAVRVQPGSALAHYFLANALDTAQRMAEAVPEYQASLRCDPNQVLTHNNLGIDLARLGRLPEAAEQFAAALRLQPDFAEGHANLGNALYLMRRWAGAIAEYEAALRLTPGDASLRDRLAAARQALFHSR